jgi:hypothetical protein
MSGPVIRPMRHIVVGRVLIGVSLTLLLAAAAAAARRAHGRDGFDHARHAKLFPTCEGCHAGVTAPATGPRAGAVAASVTDAGFNPWPAPTVCAACHDGSIERRVDWAPPAELPRTNLRFDHATHRREAASERPVLVDSLSRCATCHIEAGRPWMQVRLASVTSCLACHGVSGGHLEAPDTACATCHLPLPRAIRLAAADVGRLPAPESHRDSAFRAGAHGRAALAGARTGSRPTGVSASCATCHARDFCAACHVNAPEVPVIQALAPDVRSLAITATLRAPPSHARAEFLREHGPMAQGPTCAACHTRESCATCHRESVPRAVARLAATGPGRGGGAVVTRRRPATHGADFSESHAAIARATPRTCESCHARAECVTCHRPDAGSAPGGYHLAGFLTRHAAAAYSRQTSCAGCHNQSTFCAACHERAGLVSRGALRAGFHDAKPGFLLGHGQAARQSLESCTSCHAERDCLTCHSANGGRRFNPHGPGFDAARLRRKNPGMCTACHGQAIPGA